MLDTATCHREEADNYHTVIVHTETHRVILCRDCIQWILQRRSGKRHGLPRWASISYVTTRKALTRVWIEQTGEHSAVLDKLPETIGRHTNG